MWSTRTPERLDRFESHLSLVCDHASLTAASGASTRARCGAGETTSRQRKCRPWRGAVGPVQSAETAGHPPSCPSPRRDRLFEKRLQAAEAVRVVVEPVPGGGDP